MTSITKRKNSDSHYEENIKNVDEYITDRIKSKRMRQYSESDAKIQSCIHPEICISCSYGKMDNKCRLEMKIYFSFLSFKKSIHFQ